MTSHILDYYNSVCEAYSLGNTESSYNPAIISMFRQFGCKARDMSGKRSGQIGENIDIELWRGNEDPTETEPFAGIEVKKIDGIDERAKKNIKVEATKYGNAILTDNLRWQFWHAGEERMYAGVQLIEHVDNQLVLINENVELFVNLIGDFLLQNPSQIRSSQKLAEYMAMHARTIRSVVIGILKDDGNGNPIKNDRQIRLPMFLELYGLFSKIKEDLLPAITSREFADMYGQTIVYGLFIARYNDATLSSFDRYEAIRYLQEESALLNRFFTHIASSGRIHPTLDVVIDKLCALYQTCDIVALLDRDERRDTIVHFYEDFLTYYDLNLKKSYGVFYTPYQIVRYLVSTVDRLLVDKFGISSGLANNDHFQITVRSERYQVKKKSLDTKEINVPRVAILDPACGTGTFHAEIIKHIKKKYFSNDREAFYENYIQNINGLLSRMIGFEIMMTSYVVAHLKVRRTIDETLGHASDIHLPTKIYLTNTLAPPHSSLERNNQISFVDFSAAISDEAYKADTWKARRPIKVIIGNPPYLAASTNPYDISAYKKETDGVTDFGERKHWLNDDYVKFFRFSEQIINNNNEGILAFVSNNGYLDNNTFRGMRASLLRTFDEIYIVNLHGSANKQETAPNGSKDENVFNIMQGVALFIGVKTTSNPEWAKVYYCDLWGTREDKFQHLDDEDIDFKEIKLDQRMAYFVPYGNDDKELYEKGINIAELFPVNVTGIVSGNDNAAISSSRIELQDRIAIVKNATEETPVLNLWRKFSRGQSAEKICNDVLDPDGIITPISFRPFDERWTYYTGNSCGWLLWPREKKTMGHLLAPPSSPIEQNIGLVFCKTSRSFFSPFVSTHIIAHRLFSAMCEITYIAPLYKRTDTMMEGEVWEANLNAALYSQLTQNLSVPPSPIEVFDYVYGILHDPIYCSRFNEFLTRNFPKVPVINAPEDRENQNSFYVSEDLFRAYVTAGARLRKLHIMLVKVPATLTIEPNTPDNLDIGRIQYRNKELSLNEKKHIVGIPEDVWNYNIGGYQVLANWFKSHIGESMTRDNFNHIENIVGLLTETITIQDELRGLH